MDILEIRERTTKITTTYMGFGTPETLHDRITVAGGKQVLEKLNLILTQHTDNTPELFRALKTLLEDNHTQTLGTLLSYTARPDSDITKLLISVAVYVAVNTDQLAIQLLMPTLALESYREDKYDNLNGKALNTEAHIATLLQTHILGEGGLYLLPVKLLTELTLDAAAVQLGNPYFDNRLPSHLVSGGVGYVSPQELLRLTMHSPLTEAVGDKKQAYVALACDKSNLLGQLSQLCQQLYINAAHGGRGVHDNAASGAYPAIITFMEYFDTLDANAKKRIPAGLMKEIQTLLDLSSNSKVNATQNLSTCIASRRAGLITAMSGHNVLLSSISLSENLGSDLIRVAMAQFETAKADLNQAIKENTYQGGRDALGISVPLLEALGVEIHVRLPADLTVFQSLSPSEITEVLENEALKNETITQLRTLDNLVIFAIVTPLEQLKAFLTVMADKIVAKWLHNAADLGALLISLDVEKFGVVCESMKDRLPAIIRSPDNIPNLLGFLSPQQCASLLISMIDRLSAIIQSLDDFLNLLPFLGPQLRARLLESMIDRPSAIIQSRLDFLCIVKHFTPQQITRLWESTINRQPGMRSYFSAESFSSVMKKLTAEQRTSVYEAMKDRLPAKIKNHHEFLAILQWLTPEQITNLCESMRDRLPPWRYNLYGLDFRAYSDVMSGLNPLQRTSLAESMLDILPDMIRSEYDFNEVLSYLNPEQSKFVYDSMANRWLGFYNNDDDVYNEHDYYIVRRFVNIAAACSATLLKLTQYRHNESTLSPENKVNINSAIQAIKQARDSLRQQHFAFVTHHPPDASADMTRALNTCCDALAATLTTHILPIKQEQKLARVQRGTFSEIVHAIEKLANLSNSISQITTQLRRVDPIVVAKMAELKARLNETRANGAGLGPDKDDDTPTTP